MAPSSPSQSEDLRIIHCFRSPVGGIFRHVRDLIHQQVAQGHKVGVICDSNTGGEYEEGLLEELEPYLDLGLFRIPMDRSIGPRDLVVLYRLYGKIREVEADVLHSHGAKGGAYARLIGSLLRRSDKRNRDSEQQGQRPCFPEHPDRAIDVARARLFAARRMDPRKRLHLPIVAPRP